MNGTRIKVTVSDIRKVTPTIKQFTFRHVDEKTLPRFSAGSHIPVYFQNGEETMERHYSLISSPSNRKFYQIAIKQTEHSKGGSSYWHKYIRIGDVVDIGYPKNQFPLSFRAKHHVFFAAGIGITPFLAMAAELKSRRKSFELHYAARSKEDCAFYHEIKTLYPKEAHFYFSNQNERMRPLLMDEQPIGTHIYLCGPDSMIKEFTGKSCKYGFPKDSVHFELFQPPDFGPTKPFKVVLAKSKCTLKVPADKSLLETLLQNHVPAPHSCRAGGCGSCKIEVIEGVVDHRDTFFTVEEKQEENAILTCVSRAKTDVIILNI